MRCWPGRHRWVWDVSEYGWRAFWLGGIHVDVCERCGKHR